MGAPYLGIKVDTSQFRKFLGRYTKASRDLERDLRSRFFRHGRRLRALVLDEAPERTGEFKSKIRYRTYQGTGKMGFAIHTPLPLGKFIIGGTKEHPIPKVPKVQGSLYFFWPKGYDGARFYAFKQVMHPGTKPNPFLGRAYKRWLPGARRMITELSKEFVVRITR